MCGTPANNNTVSYDIGYASVIGTREEQQDAMLLETNRNGLFAAICDGMGGLNHGNQASTATIEKLKELLGAKEKTESYPQFFLKVVDILDENICILRKTMKESGMMGTTIVSAAVEGSMLFWFSVGDSRLYLIRNGEIVCVTSDHNYFWALNKAYQNGQITEEVYSAQKHKGEALISYLGMGGIELMDINTKPFLLRANDIVLLVSDGLYRCVSDAEILQIVQRYSPAARITEKLIDAAESNAMFSQDNTSIITIKVTEN